MTERPRVIATEPIPVGTREVDVVTAGVLAGTALERIEAGDRVECALDPRTGQLSVRRWRQS